ncbi:MAG: SDR family NAD(P)-dependent oxidoreductase, partial [Phycisphaerae bacterium]|nr:SDR family NAD(P)-dependent oxidoreductase [Phycisphaerae bacterium]
MSNAVREHSLAIVTGAARRVGRATAIALAQRGFNLAITRRESAADLAETAELAVASARAAGHTITVRQDALDMADHAAVQAYAQSVGGGSYGAVDVLVHNASQYRAGALGAITATDAMADYAVNAVAPLLLTQGLRGALEKSSLDGGALVV